VCVCVVPPFYILFISIFCPFVVVATCVECAAHFIRMFSFGCVPLFLSSFGMQFKILHTPHAAPLIFFRGFSLCTFIFPWPLTWPLSWVIAINYYRKFITTNGAEIAAYCRSNRS